MMNDEGKTGSEEAKKIGRAEKAEEKRKRTKKKTICVNRRYVQSVDGRFYS
jgi:hypothetical protein